MDGDGKMFRQDKRRAGLAVASEHGAETLMVVHVDALKEQARMLSCSQGGPAAGGSADE